jgi:PAS domain-containing protein
VWAIPLASLLLAWTNPWHHLIWTGIVLPAGPLPFALYRYGWWFWVLTAQHYLLMVAATYVLLRSMRTISHGFRTGMTLVLLAVVLPWVGNAAYNLKLGPWPGLNWLTLSLGISGWLLVWVVLREGLLDVLPHAEHELVAMMDDAVLVLDWRGVLIYRNAAARAKDLDAVTLAAALGVDTLVDIPVHTRTEVQMTGDGTPRWLDVRVGPVFDRWGGLAGRLAVARDISARKSVEAQREQLIAELQSALSKVTQLEGMLPICANCRKVRDDKGYWDSIEDYVGRRSALQFTHGICPDCTDRLYPELSGKPNERWKI